MTDLVERSRPRTFKEFTLFKGVIDGIIEGFKQRYCIFDQIHWKSFYSSMYDVLGDAANAILMKIGEDFGRELFSVVQEQFEADPKIVFLFILQELEKLGWGAFWNVKIDAEFNEITLEVHNSNEAYNKGIASCYHMHGTLRGISSKLLGKDIEVREIECIAKGDKICKYVIGTKDIVPELYDKQKIENLIKILQELKFTIKSSIEIFATTDGVPILTSKLPGTVNSHIWTTIISILLAGSKKSSDYITNGNLKEIVVNAEQGIIIATRVTENTMLAAVISPDSSPGLAGLAMKKAKDKIINVVQ